MAREVHELEDRIGSRVGSLARRFDRVVRILEIWGYLDDWALTESGERLASLFHESDLLLAEAIGQGLLDDLDPAALAGVVSLFTYEHRSPDAPPRRGSRRRRSAIDAGRSPRWRPSSRHRGRSRARPHSSARSDVPRGRHAWAAGEALDDVLEDEDLSGGDFVRNVKQVIDLLGQVADVTDQPTSAAAREAAARLYRGVVAASSAVATSE